MNFSLRRISHITDMTKARQEAEASIKYHEEQARAAKTDKKRKQHQKIADNIKRILRINQERQESGDV